MSSVGAALASAAVAAPIALELRAGVFLRIARNPSVASLSAAVGTRRGRRRWRRRRSHARKEEVQDHLRRPARAGRRGAGARVLHAAQARPAVRPAPGAVHNLRGGHLRAELAVPAALRGARGEGRRQRSRAGREALQAGEELRCVVDAGVVPAAAPRPALDRVVPLRALGGDVRVTAIVLLLGVSETGNTTNRESDHYFTRSPRC